MIFFDSSISRFHIADTTGTSHDLSGSITDIDGIPGSRSLLDITSLTDDGPVYVAGVGSKPVTLTGIFADDTDDVLGALLSHESSTEFSYAPAGTSSGSVKYTGLCWVERYEVSPTAGDRVGYTATLRVEGSIARGVH